MVTLHQLEIVAERTGRCVTGKVKYLDQWTAEMALCSAAKKGWTRLAAYACKQCPYWHIGRNGTVWIEGRQ